MTTIIQALNEDVVYETKLLEKTLDVFEKLGTEQSSVVITESLIDLRSDVRRFLINHPKVSLRLATTLAQIFVVAEELEKELGKSTKYKEATLRGLMEKILKISSELASKDDSSHPRLTDAMNFVLDKLEGNSDKITTIKNTFNKIIQRLESNDTTLRLKAMKFTSLIMQSNDNKAKRREVINQL